MYMYLQPRGSSQGGGSGLSVEVTSILARSDNEPTPAHPAFGGSSVWTIRCSPKSRQNADGKWSFADNAPELCGGDLVLLESVRWDRCALRCLDVSADL